MNWLTTRAPPPISTGEWEKSTLLGYEREMLGLYVSDHPLMGAEASLRRRTECTLDDIISEVIDDPSGERSGEAGRGEEWCGHDAGAPQFVSPDLGVHHRTVEHRSGMLHQEQENLELGAGQFDQAVAPAYFMTFVVEFEIVEDERAGAVHVGATQQRPQAGE